MEVGSEAQKYPRMRTICELCVKTVSKEHGHTLWSLSASRNSKEPGGFAVSSLLVFFYVPSATQSSKHVLRLS